MRRKIAGQFEEFLRKTAAGEAPWQLYGVKDMREELLYFADNIENFATREIGMGDMSIIYAYKQYIKEIPAIGSIMIWSTGHHFREYHSEHVSITRRRRKG